MSCKRDYTFRDAHRGAFTPESFKNVGKDCGICYISYILVVFSMPG